MEGRDVKLTTAAVYEGGGTRTEKAEETNGCSASCPQT